jgi:hypothetical protein
VSFLWLVELLILSLPTTPSFKFCAMVEFFITIFQLIDFIFVYHLEFILSNEYISRLSFSLPEFFLSYYLTFSFCFITSFFFFLVVLGLGRSSTAWVSPPAHYFVTASLSYFVFVFLILFFSNF